MLTINKQNIREYLYRKIDNSTLENIELLENYPQKKTGENTYIHVNDVYDNIDDILSIDDNTINLEVQENQFDNYLESNGISFSLIIDDPQYLHLNLKKFGNNEYIVNYHCNGSNIKSSIREVIIKGNTYINEITIENEVELILENNHFKQITCKEVPLDFKTLDGKKLEIDKLSLRKSHLSNVKQKIRRIELLEVLDQNTNIILENCDIYFLYLKYPDNEKIHIFNCVIKYKRSLFAKYASYFRNPLMLNNFQSIYEILLKKDYLKKYSVELHKYVLYFNARKDRLKRFFYFLNQGYYSIFSPAVILGALLLINNYIPYSKPIIIEYNTITYLINPGEFLKLINDDYQNSFLLWSGRMLYRIVFYYSLFSLFIAVKRKYGFAKKSDLQI